MHVIIIGVGEVGGYLAQRLVAEDIDVTVVEVDPKRAAQIGEDLDIQVVTGSGSSPRVLRQAGIDTANLVAAVTPNDEVNLIASFLAKENNVETTIVRLENPELRGEDTKQLLAAVGADVVIDPDAETADRILELVHTTGVDEVYPMADGDLLIIGATLMEDTPLVNRSLEEIGRSLGEDRPLLFGALTRRAETVIPGGDQTLLAGDHVRVLCKSQAQPEVLDLLGVAGQRARRVMILGGGAVGAQLAERLEYEGVHVTLVERDVQRAQQLSTRFFRSVIIHGDITDIDLLREETIGQMDAVVATTGEDSSNVLACAFAIGEGAPFTVAVLHDLALLPMVRRFGIDAAMSPRTASANTVLKLVRGGATAVATFLESDSEVDEIQISSNCDADGSKVEDLDLPDNILIGAVISPGKPPEIARGSTVLHADDRIVVFGSANAMASAKSLFRT